MRWSEIRSAYPDQWLIVEALEAHTTPDHQRQLERLSVLETCSDGSTALQGYRRLHQECPQRELYFVHTSRDEIDVEERPWLGLLDDMSLLEVTDQARALATTVVQEGLLSQKAFPDALHIAITTAHQVDYLVTWNCSHIANAVILPRVAAICERFGLLLPYVCTPEELLGDPQ